MPSGHPEQVDFPAGQVTFHCHLPDGPRHGYESKTQTKTYPGKAIFDRYLPEGQAGIQVFFPSPVQNTRILQPNASKFLFLPTIVQKCK